MRPQRARFVLERIAVALGMGFAIAAVSELLRYARGEASDVFSTERVLIRLAVWAAAGAIWGSWEWRTGRDWLRPGRSRLDEGEPSSS